MGGRGSGATPRSTFSVMTRWQAEIGAPKKYKPRGVAPDPRLSMRGELRRAIVWRSRCRNTRRRSFWRWRGRGRFFRSFRRGWWRRRWGWNEAFVLLLGLTMRVVNSLPLRMDLLGPWSDRRLLRRIDLDRLDRCRFYSRQPNISRYRRRLGRLQQARCHPQRKKHQSSNKEHSASLRPANPQTHNELSPQIEEFSPWRSGGEGRAALHAACTFSAFRSLPAANSPPKKLSGEGHPTLSYATLSRSSAMSASWSSTQSPGFREKTSSLRRCARSRRSSGSIVSAR